MQLGIQCWKGPFIEKEIQQINRVIHEYQKVHN
jgi:hypothetical protein